MTILKNLLIPSTMTLEGLDYLGRMAKSVPENGVIVEIGPLFGSSTWVLAKNAHPSVRVFSIDTWEPAAWIDKVEAKYRGCKPFSKDAFSYYTRGCTNVTAIQGWSPEVVSDWDLPIDMFFDDATHGDPGFSDNLNFFAPFVKPNAILCGDDYAQGWPDIVRVVDTQAKKWQAHPEVIGRVWAIRTPPSQGTSSTEVEMSPFKLPGVPNIGLTIENRSGLKTSFKHGQWVGALHKKDLLKSLQIDFDAQGLEIELQCHIRSSKGREINLKEHNFQYKCDEDEWLQGIRMSISGKQAKRFKLIVDGHFARSSEGGNLIGILGSSNNGWVAYNEENFGLAGIRVCLKPKNAVRIQQLRSLISSIRSKKFMYLCHAVILRLRS